MELSSILWIVGIFAVIGLIAAALFLLFFERATKEISIIRTGFGGEKIIMDNGGFIFPVLHDALIINMNVIKLVIKREKHEAYITKNKLRVDLIAEFSLRVTPEPRAISLAGQTLGEKTVKTEELQEQLEASCAEALREATAKMDIQGLHDDNDQVNAIVEEALGVDIRRFGLQLEAVALAKVQQTDLEFFDRNNALDVEGITFVETKVAENEREQNRVKNEKDVAVKESDVAARKKQLKLDEEKVFAEQAQELAITKAELDKDRQKEEAKMQESIAVAAAHKATAEAWIETYEAQAKEVAKKEEIITAKDVTMAQRNKDVEIISASREAERTKIFAKAQADADKLNASAVEMRYEVDAAGKRAINEASNILSDKQISMQVKEKIVQQLPDIIKQSVKPIENIEGIKIMQIDGMSHLTGGAGGGNGGSNGGGGSLADQVVDSALRYKAQAPMVENLLKEVGLSGVGIKDLTAGLQKDMGFELNPAETPTKETPEPEPKPEIIKAEQSSSDKSDSAIAEGSNDKA
ncbi:MAG TPA: band 7 protein [Gammaproteobacteria bacterium]|nr:band 7 protein [Gammaproteobacteria bacterium]